MKETYGRVRLLTLAALFLPSKLTIKNSIFSNLLFIEKNFRKWQLIKDTNKSANQQGYSSGKHRQYKTKNVIGFFNRLRAHKM